MYISRPKTVGSGVPGLKGSGDKEGVGPKSKNLIKQSNQLKSPNRNP